MGFIQKDAFRTMIITYAGLLLGYLNKGVLFILILSTKEIGLINLILSVGMLFAHFSNLGTINSISKFLPFFKGNVRQKQSFFALNIILIICGIIFFSLLTILLHSQIVHFYSQKSELFVDYYYWIIPVGIANVFFLVFETYLKALYNNILAVFLYELILRVLITLLLILLAVNMIDFNQFLVLHCFVYFIPSFILFIYLLKINEIRLKKNPLNISKKFKKIIFSFSLFSYTNSIGGLIVMTLDALMIAFFLGLKETGIYTTIIYLTSALQIPYKALTRVASPLIPQYWKEKNLTKMGDLYRQVSSISLIFSLFMFLLVWVNRVELFSFLPNEYQDGILVFLFLMMGRIVDMYSGLNTLIFMTSKKFKYEMIFTAILLVLVFAFNLWLIPVYGIIGSAISTGFAIIVANLGRILFVYFIFNLHPFEKNQLYILLLFFTILGLFIYIPDFNINTYAQIILNSILLTILFFGVIIKFKWNGDLNEYINKALFFLKGKIQSKM